jgi:hypothetical protein
MESLELVGDWKRSLCGEPGCDARAEQSEGEQNGLKAGFHVCGLLSAYPYGLRLQTLVAALMSMNVSRE